VNRAVRKDGLVIQPDRPASYIDAMFDGTTTIGLSIWSGKKKQNGFLVPFYTQKPNICQERLGTNIGKTQKKRSAFLQAILGSTQRMDTFGRPRRQSIALLAVALLVKVCKMRARFTF